MVRKSGASARSRTRAVAVMAVVGWIAAAGCSDESPQPGAAPAPAAAPATASNPESTSAAGETAPASGDPAGNGSRAESSGAPAVADSRTPEERIEAGRGVYNANCIACHAMDPRRDGALGPAVAGASSELIEARVLRGEYPAGYTPRRATKVMIPLPYLESKLSELAAYLQSLD